MKIKWLHVIRDIIIITVCYFIGGFMIGYTTKGMYTRESVLISTSLLAIVGYCICGCLTPENRWKHLWIVTLGVWLTNFFPYLIFTSDLVTWISSVQIFITMFLGGALSFLFVKAPQQKDVQNSEKNTLR